MAPFRLRARRWLAVLVISAGGTGAMAGNAAAQAGGIIYEKILDLNLNPVRGRGSPGLVPGQAPGQTTGNDWLLRTGRELRPLADGAQNLRIINGQPAAPGAWQSTLSVAVGVSRYKQSDGEFQCGGTLIDERWVLTAAHCVFDSGTGGLTLLKWVAAFASQKVFDRSRALPVKAVYVHREYIDRWFANDIALLELEMPIALPRQKLAASAGQAGFLVPGTMATAVGWGSIKPFWKPGDKADFVDVQQQASLPIVEKKSCDAFRFFGNMPGRPLQDDQFCAGYGQDESKPRTCVGDSGGPLFVAGEGGEPIQAGITSWGVVGCPSYYSMYTNVGHFESWIRQRVPNAVFALPPQAGAPAGPLQQIAGVEPGGPPAPNGQCAVDIKADGIATSRVRLGAQLTIQVNSGVTGQLGVFSRSASGNVVQLFPNRYSAASRGEPTPLTIRAGDTVAIPSPADNFTLRADPPAGTHVIIAVVVPEGVRLADITRSHDGMAPIDNFRAVIQGIADATRREQEASPGAPRAVCTRQFLVTE